MGFESLNPISGCDSQFMNGVDLIIASEMKTVGAGKLEIKVGNFGKRR